MSQREFVGFSSLLVGLNKEFSETSDENQAIYEAARETQVLDALNILYVAMTRPEKELHIISYDPKKISNTYADLFVEYVRINDLPKCKENQFIVGELTTNLATSPIGRPTKTAKWIVNPNVDATFRKSKPFGSQDKNNAVDFGHVFHEIMARTYVKTYVEEAVQYAHSQGNIGTDQLDHVQNIIELANKVSSQSVEIYTNAQDAKDSVEKTLSKLDNVMGKIKDGKGSLLSKISKMVSVGGLSPKKEIPD